MDFVFTNACVTLQAISDGRLLCSYLKKNDVDRVSPQLGDMDHILDVIQRLIRAHRDIDAHCEQRKLRLHSRLALIAFKNDARLVRSLTFPNTVFHLLAIPYI